MSKRLSIDRYNNLDDESKTKLGHLAQLELIRRRRTNFKDFVKYIEPEFQIAWFHELIMEEIQKIADGEPNNIIISVPPRHGKSYLTSWLAPAYLLGRNPKLKILATSYAPDLAMGNSVHVQRYMSRPEYKALFPKSKLPNRNDRLYKISKSEFDIVGTGGRYRAFGTGQAVTGFGANVIIIDDPFKDSMSARKESVRDSVWQFYNSLSTRRESNPSYIVIMTRWHEDDLVGRILRKEEEEQEHLKKNWKVLSFPSIAEYPLNERDPRAIGEALFPSVRPLNFLEEQLSVLGSYEFNAQFQQRPVPPDGGMFKKDWWVYYNDLPPTAFDFTQSWDAAFKGGVDNDYVVGQLWARDTRDKSVRYLVDEVRGQWDFTETIRQIRAFSTKHPNARKILIEEKANGAAIISTLKSEMQGIIPIIPKDSKESRAYSVTPMFEAGNVVIPRYASWLDEYKHEFETFPKGTNDDRVDATAQYLLYSREEVNKASTVIYGLDIKI